MDCSSVSRRLWSSLILAKSRSFRRTGKRRELDARHQRRELADQTQEERRLAPIRADQVIVRKRRIARAIIVQFADKRIRTRRDWRVAQDQRGVADRFV